MKRSARGYALIVVLLVLALIAVAVGVVMNALKASGDATGTALKARQAFYGCDGMVRTLTRIAASHLMTGDPNTAALADALCTTGGGGCSWDGVQISLGADPIPNVRPGGFRVVDLQVASLARTGCAVDAECGSGGVCVSTAGGPVCRRVAPLPDGAFAGMQALSDTISIAVEAERTAGGQTCRAGQEVAVGKVALTQFFAFSALAYTDWQPPRHTVAQGHVHVNGDLCLGGPASGGDRFFLSRVTSARDLQAMDGTQCRTDSAFGHDDVMIAKDASAEFDANSDGNTSDVVVGDFDELEPADRTAGTWKDNAIAKWGAQAQDRAHNIRALTLPVVGAAAVPDGRDAALAARSNAATMRFLVEPVQAGDDPSVRAQKLAEKADVRVLNGVWYLNDGTWPGQPIWSDHPGTMTTVADNVEPAALAVGQGDLFGASARPRRYSYYATTAADLIDFVPPSGTGRAVVSYGALARDTTTGWALWRPGARCPDGSIYDATVDVLTACGAVAGARTKSASVVEATRSGFRDAHVERALEGAFSQRTDSLANMLPLNFDVGAFQEALADTSAGELGAALAARGRPFNGIVYIASSWVDAGASPPTPLRMGASDNDATQPAAGAHAQRELPFALCTSASPPAPLTPPSSGLVFTAPECARYRLGDADANKLRAHYNAVRIINARNVNVNGSTDPSHASTVDAPEVPNGQLPDGLTIATNLPLYVAGDVNLSSNARVTNTADPAYRWVPVMLAGDSVHVLSNAWDDATSRWHESVDCRTSGGSFACATLPTWPRDATTTRWTAHVLGGLPETSPSVLNNAAASYSGGLESLVRAHEDWDTAGFIWRGGLVAGWLPVWPAPPPTTAAGAMSGELLDVQFDPHLARALDQPPGAPTFDITSIRQWTRR